MLLELQLCSVQLIGQQRHWSRLRGQCAMEGVAPAKDTAAGASCCCCLLVALSVAHPTTAVGMRTLPVLLLTFTAVLAALFRVQEEAGEIEASLLDTCLAPGLPTPLEHAVVIRAHEIPCRRVE